MSMTAANQYRRVGLMVVALSVVHGLAAAPSAKPPHRLDLVVQADVAHRELSPEFCWFHPRVAPLPGYGTGGQPAVIMTLQKHLVADDHYSGLYFMRTDDLGQTWRGPTEVPELAWQEGPGGETIAVCDVTPGWHGPTGRLLAIGTKIRYSASGGQLVDEARSHECAYAVLDPQTDAWSAWQMLAMPDTADKFFLVAPGCVQWLSQPDGTLLLPVYFKGASGSDYSVTVLHCAFDGEQLTYLSHGDELTITGGRGLCEPSLAWFQGRYFLTLRNDARAYVTTSADGLHFAPIQAWTFDDGQDLGSYNTQAHWLVHSEGLFLTYTRRGANNDHIARNRAPLFVAQVDPDRLHVIRQTEQVVLPERGVMLGNFGATAITPDESWVTDAEFISRLVDPEAGTRPHPRGADGTVWLGRIKWSVPNRLALGAASPAEALDPSLIGWWKLDTDARDASGNGLHATNQGVLFHTADSEGDRCAAVFDGRHSHLVIPASPTLRLGHDDFTISLWVSTEDTLDDDLGDLVTWYDASRRVGFNLALRTNTGVTTSQANTRQLQFGIDSGSQPQWSDVGRPGNAVFVMALAVHDDDLYAGTAEGGSSEVGHVYRYAGPGDWVDCGAPDASNAISALAVHEGRLYAASSKYRFAGSALPESQNPHAGGGIYRYDGQQRWTEVGRLPETEAIGGLVTYQGRLYASALYKPAGFFRYEADGQWLTLEVPEGRRVESLGVFNGYLWATSYDGGWVFRYDGRAWRDFGQLGENTQTYSFAIHRGRLCVGTWPSGRVFRLAPDDTWEDLGRLGEELEVMGMLVHNGQLYAGTLPLAEVFRYEGGQTWTPTGRLDTTPDVTYRRAWTMAQYQGRLFCSTLPSGHVHALKAGVCVTHDRELAPGWRHVAAVKHGGVLRLYVDGRQVAESTPFDATAWELTTDQPLLIGAGAGDYFHGMLRDVRLYRRALSREELLP